jgi:hypothetical protein
VWHDGTTRQRPRSRSGVEVQSRDWSGVGREHSYCFSVGSFRGGDETRGSPPRQRAPHRCVFVGGLKLLWMEVQALDAQEPPSAVEVTGMRRPCAALRQWAGVPVQMWQGRAPVPVQMWQGRAPVPVQMSQGRAPVPVQMWQG